MSDLSEATAQLILLVLFIGLSILFMLTQYRTLELIRPQIRYMAPGQVWLQLIPIYGLFFQFTVIRKISDSIRDELNTPIGDSIFGEDPVPINHRPTYGLGVSYATLFCISILPFMVLTTIVALAGLLLWGCYWIQLSQYKTRIKQRAMLFDQQ